MKVQVKKLLIGAAVLLPFLSSGLAFAHEGHDRSVGFMSGLLHPISGIDHLLVIVLVGFWSAFVLRKIWLGPCIFMLGMCLGVFFGLSPLPLGFFEFGIAGSAIGMGLLLLSRNQSSPKLILLLISAFGVFHGFAHADLFSNSSFGIALVAQDMAGLILATGVLHLSGALLAKALKEKTALIAKVAGFSSVIYGWVLIGQLSFALIGGASA